MADHEDVLPAGFTKAHKIIDVGPSFNQPAPKCDG